MGSPRLASFDISLMPADRAFFFLLLGSTFLLISPDLGWWNAWQMNTLGASGISNLSTAKHWLSVWREILLLKIAGAAGFFVCFFLGSMPLRRLRLWVYLPAALGVALPFLFVSAVSLAMRTGANPCGNGDIFALSGTSRIAWSAGPGLHFSVLGLVCIAFAVSRISRGLAVLPIHLNATPLQAGDVPQRRMGLTLVMRWHTTMGAG